MKKNGNKYLAKIIDRLLESGSCSVTNLDKFLDENKPSIEVKLWEGIDGKGSSWSCSHGIGRWHRDCGCSDGPHNYNQEWREHLRNAFDELRYNIRQICDNESKELVFDFIDARNDYVSVILNPSTENREAFLDKHAIESLSERGKIKLWKLLEADRNAMLMYTSCGWFFSDISGFEPQQNMRYALRAAELTQEFSDYNLISLLQDRLKKAVSNIPGMGTGEDIFNNYVLTTRYTPKHLCAIYSLLNLYSLSLPKFNSDIKLSHTTTSENSELKYIIGFATCTDNFTLEKFETAFIGFTDKKGLNTGVCFAPDISQAKKLIKLKTNDLLALLNDEGIKLSELPYSERKALSHIILEKLLNEADHSLHNFFYSHKPVFEHLNSNKLPIPAHLKAIGEEALSYKLMQCIKNGIKNGIICENCINTVNDIKAQAYKYGLTLNVIDTSRLIAKFMSSRLINLLSNLTEETVNHALNLLIFIQDNEFWLENWEELLDRYWRILHLPPREMPKSRTIVDNMRAIGDRLYFSKETVKHLTQILFSTPV